MAIHWAPLKVFHTTFYALLLRSETLALLHSISSDSFTLEAGRRWSVALIRQGSHVEFGRLPVWMVPALVGEDSFDGVTHWSLAGDYSSLTNEDGRLRMMDG